MVRAQVATAVIGVLVPKVSAQLGLTMSCFLQEGCLRPRACLLCVVRLIFPSCGEMSKVGTSQSYACQGWPSAYPGQLQTASHLSAPVPPL